MLEDSVIVSVWTAMIASCCMHNEIAHVSSVCTFFLTAYGAQLMHYTTRNVSVELKMRGNWVILLLELIARFRNRGWIFFASIYILRYKNG